MKQNITYRVKRCAECGQAYEMLSDDNGYCESCGNWEAFTPHERTTIKEQTRMTDCYSAME